LGLNIRSQVSGSVSDVWCLVFKVEAEVEAEIEVEAEVEAETYLTLT